MNDWNLQSRSRQCHGCEQGFEDQQVYHSLLFTEKGDYVRMDICHACWKSEYEVSQGASKGYVSHWKGIYQAPPPPPPEAIRKDTAETLIKKLIERNLPEYAGATYILAVMLERKRILKVRDQMKRNGQRVFVYEHPKSGDVFAITEPDLRLDQLEKIRHDVTDLMENGLPDERVQEEEAPAASTEALDDSTPDPSEASTESPHSP